AVGRPREAPAQRHPLVLPGPVGGVVEALGVVLVGSVNARVDPRPTRGAAVVLQLRERGQRRRLLQVARVAPVAVDLLEDQPGRWLVLDRGFAILLLVDVVPDQRLDGTVALLLAVVVQLLEPEPEVHREPDVGAAVL